MRIWALRCHACSFERRTVGDSDVPVDPIKDGRMIASNGVDVSPRGCFLFGPQRVVPTAAYDPLARPGGLDPRGDALLHVIERFAAH